ncbi:hypothetical protein PAAG_05554 [Paracoccidioides lutzii Pb01]|uniref:F-box domain-containing protein n=1 Tax=Paracoccidioides lutzii (strain ATCC MYA-826 / Pb01) TaxID=502779 RepID=C1H461_PARBA|nr:hypothetical protein PAAG_05554 [Paracoccidioides lutzii Pb01]EEH34505.2 hypothetical protein PAAG_05554 [Paracoccidioides lutzii Pb01]
MSNVHANMFGASVGDLAIARKRPSLMSLPLNLIAAIVAHLDNVADLARLCRTCRVLNYMTLPLLYKDLSLTSYDKIRYRDEIAEGCGSASPFSMALNAVVTRNVGGLVRSLTLRGHWREDELEEHARVGRVPDSSMMLNIVVRAAVDKMSALESVSWQLNTKMLETVYQGLAQLPNLTSLTVRFPSSRHPRPTAVIPPMPHLRCLKITDIDPLCYPDDISTLLYESKKLRELGLHWSYRMREEQEASVSLSDYFRKCLAAKSPLTIKKISFQNLYAFHREEVMHALDHSVLEDLTLFNAPKGADDNVSFVEYSWPLPKYELKIKSLRSDRLDTRSCEFLAKVTEVERLYLVNGFRNAGDYINSPRNLYSHSSTSPTPSSSDVSSTKRSGNASAYCGYPASRAHTVNFTSQSHQSMSNFQPYVRDLFVQTITSTQGPRLRHLLLPSRWPLPPALIGRLVRSCPNLEQLALATDLSSMESVSLLLPFLLKLVALRLLIPTSYATSDPNSGQGIFSRDAHLSAPNGDVDGYGQHRFFSSSGEVNSQIIAQVVDMDDRIHNETMGASLADMELFGTLKIIGLGWKAWELGELYTIPRSEATREFRFIEAHAIALKYQSMTASRSSSSCLTPAGAGGPPEGNITIPETGQHERQKTSKTWPTTLSSLGKRKQPPDSNGDSRNNDNDKYDNISNLDSPSSPSPSLISAFTIPTNQQFPQAPSQTSPSSTTATSVTPPAECQTQAQPTNPLKTRLQPSPPSPFELNPPFTYNSTGELVSQETIAEVTRCIFTEQTRDSEMLYRRRVKRVGWEVLKHWEIWGLDVQEI